jgi:hypothetical protein
MLGRCVVNRDHGLTTDVAGDAGPGRLPAAGMPRVGTSWGNLGTPPNRVSAFKCFVANALRLDGSSSWEIG